MDSFKSVKEQLVNRPQIQALFIKMGIVIIFSDLSYSLLYLAFSGNELKGIQSFGDYFQLLGEYANSFYYAFCMHFSAPMPTADFYLNMEKVVKESLSLQIIQFFHFCLNKIIDIMVLAYAAGVILKVFGILKEKKE
ncbi:hypothetical protein [Paenibacillus paeoniae]|uniref:Uncharacterized protein n=1 Tax=Paenibacillus paeoniae TaxID=2292705 RepID=A0A371PNA4_9BACL|nr:hypothetical protein [Paenibacillus paeoniae]REK77668.1 hypothetical protein DX130_11935 [Paenibacillus paeoniae]